jgi:putative copper export protein
MNAVVTLFLIVHIISAGIWVSGFAVDIAFNRLLKNNAGKPVELPLQMARLRVHSVMGSLGGIGILLTGLILTVSLNYGVFNIGGMTPTWLLIKQFIFLIALLIVFVVVTPAQRRLVPLIAAAAQGTPKMTSEIEAGIERMNQLGLVINALVVVNIILGVWKPF